MFWEPWADTIRFEFPSKISELGHSAFKWCRCRSVNCIPASVEIIRAKCFRKCSFLAFVGFERYSRLTVIEDLAFSGCMLLTTIRIPASVRRIGNRCFSNCESLTQILFESPSQLYELGDFWECSLDRIDIPDSVHIIGLLPLARDGSSCRVMFGRGSQLGAISVVVDSMEVSLSRRAFVRYSEGALRRLRTFATINCDQ
jgi:hypothetical protein